MQATTALADTVLAKTIIIDYKLSGKNPRILKELVLFTGLEDTTASED